MSGAGISGLASLAGGGGVGSGAGADAGGGGGGSSFLLQLANVKARANRVITDNGPNFFFILPPTQKSLTPSSNRLRVLLLGTLPLLVLRTLDRCGRADRVGDPVIEQN